jgi:hypothetical protein
MPANLQPKYYDEWLSPDVQEVDRLVSMLRP